jgi:GNAT superfamily N-acetyltransferase
MRPVLADAATAFRDVPGVEVIDDGDLVRSWAPGRPAPYLHAIARLDVEPASFTERATALDRRHREAGLPALWWLDEDTRPSDAAERLTALGIPASGGEAVMARMVGAAAGEAAEAATAEAAVRAAAGGVAVARVRSVEDLDEWIEAVAAAYGWTDRRRADLMRDLYDPRRPHGRDPRRIQVVARLGGVAVGAASLFVAAGQGWITNVGTVPSARGRGVGAAVTAACLGIAAERGDPEAWLAASAMGEPVYARLGFVTVGRLQHHAGGAPGG